jgi:hypothetical protein
MLGKLDGEIEIVTGAARRLERAHCSRDTAPEFDKPDQC